MIASQRFDKSGLLFRECPSIQVVNEVGSTKYCDKLPIGKLV